MSSLPVDKIKSSEAPYYAEAARFWGAKDELTIEDVRQISGRSGITPAEFRKLIAGIRRSPSEERQSVRPFAQFKRASVQDFSLEFIRPDLARVEILPAAKGHVSHLEVGAAYYIDSTTPRTVSVVKTRTQGGQKVVSVEKLSMKATDNVTNTPGKNIFYKGYGPHFDGEAGPAGSKTAKYANTAWNLSVMLAVYGQGFGGSPYNKTNASDPTVDQFQKAVRSLSTWLDHMTPDPNCVLPHGNWYCPRGSIRGSIENRKQVH